MYSHQPCLFYHSSIKHNLPWNLLTGLHGERSFFLSSLWLNWQLCTGGLKLSRRGRAQTAIRISWVILGVSGPPSASQMVFTPPWYNCTLEIMLADLFFLPFSNWFLFSKLLVSGVFWRLLNTYEAFCSQTRTHSVLFCASFKHENSSINFSSPRKLSPLLLAFLNYNFLLPDSPLHLDFDFKPSSVEPSESKLVTKNRRKALKGAHGTVKKNIDFETR